MECGGNRESLHASKLRCPVPTTPVNPANHGVSSITAVPDTILVSACSQPAWAQGISFDKTSSEIRWCPQSFLEPSSHATFFFSPSLSTSPQISSQIDEVWGYVLPSFLSQSLPWSWSPERYLDQMPSSPCPFSTALEEIWLTPSHPTHNMCALSWSHIAVKPQIAPHIWVQRLLRYRAQTPKSKLLPVLTRKLSSGRPTIWPMTLSWAFSCWKTVTNTKQEFGLGILQVVLQVPTWTYSQ